MSGIITGPYFKTSFGDRETGLPPTAAQIGTVVSVLEVGAFVTSLLAGRLADIKGRRWVIAVGSLVFTGGGLLQAGATNLWVLGLGRIISGLGVGFLSMIVPIYQSEVSRPALVWKLSPACLRPGS
jgi:MFS family permease